MAKQTIQSVKPEITQTMNNQLTQYGVDYKLQQASPNSEIDKAIDDYFSKNVGTGGNRPDVKALLADKYGHRYPVLIKYNGYKDKLVKLDAQGQVENKTAKNEWNFKSFNSYAVNGASVTAAGVFANIMSIANI